jgi:hypothetical protein
MTANSPLAADRALGQARVDSLSLSLHHEQGDGSSHLPRTGWTGGSTSWARGEAKNSSLPRVRGMASCKRSYDRSYGGASHRIAVRPKPSYPGRPAGRENREVWREDSAYWRGLGLVGAGGFEPPNTGSKVPRLTPVEVGDPARGPVRDHRDSTTPLTAPCVSAMPSYSIQSTRMGRTSRARTFDQGVNSWLRSRPGCARCQFCRDLHRTTLEVSNTYDAVAQLITHT